MHWGLLFSIKMMQGETDKLEFLKLREVSQKSGHLPQNRPFLTEMSLFSGHLSHPGRENNS